MAATVVGGVVKWNMTRDEEGHREYKVTHRVWSPDNEDGPANVIRAAGLPAPGAVWAFEGDSDPYAYCRMNATVTPDHDNEKQGFWLVDQTFSTKPDKGNCKDTQIENPLLTPPKTSGGFTKFQEEATHDRNGRRVLNSAWELVRGPHNEWDASRPTIKIEQNVSNLELALFSQMVDTVNQYPLWGLPKRTIKLDNVPWSANFYGSCFVYYTRTLEFSVRYRRVYGVASGYAHTGTGSLVPSYVGEYETFDRRLLDEGTKVLNGHWDRVNGNWVVDPIAALPAPVLLSATSDVGGSMSGATYTYTVTAVNSSGETIESNSLQVSTLPLGSLVNLSWRRVRGATGYKIYGRVPGPAYGLVGTVSGGTTTTFTDYGFNIPGNSPPSSNTTEVSPDPNNPSHFIRFQDVNGNVARVILNGAGLPATVPVTTGTGTGTSNSTVYAPGTITIEKYGESDFLLLGVPVVLG